MFELPPSYTKRKLYERYCFQKGHKIKADADGSYPKVEQYPPRTDFDDVLWPVGSVPQPVCSWSTFRSIWKEEFKSLRIRKASEDICGQCVLYQNRWRHQSKKKNADSDSEPEEEVVDTSHPLYENSMAPIAEARAVLEKYGPTREEQEEQENENLQRLVEADGDQQFEAAAELDPLANAAVLRIESRVSDAYLHVQMARAHREAANKAISQAKECVGNEHSCRHYCVTMDYAQNLGLPHFGANQPGETYYYSPLNVNVFGIVDNSCTPETLDAYAYHEGEAAKGANQVTSLLVKYLRDRNLLIEGETGASLTILADNCSGQNKNNTVLRLAVWLVEMNYFQRVQFLFYIKGHTKNVCDRMFNLMKQNFHKHDVYSMEQLLSCLSKQSQVTVHHPMPNEFSDWTKMFDKYHRSYKHVKINHVFTCDRSNSAHKVMVQKWIGEDEYDKAAGGWDMKKRVANPIANRSLLLLTDAPDPLVPPGIQEIKKVELFKKWRPFVPMQHQDSICPHPGQEVLDNVAKDKRNKRNAKKKTVLTSRSLALDNINAR